MLDPTDAAVLVVAIFVVTIGCLLALVARRLVDRPRTLHAVPVLAPDGRFQRVAVYGTDEADAIRRAQRMQRAVSMRAAPQYEKVPGSFSDLAGR